MAKGDPGAPTNADVLVVGAGPAGLLLAAELVRRGVGCLLVDLLDAPQPWDRATVLHSRSLEIFESLGIAEPFLERGVKTRKARFRSGGAVLGELDLTLNDTPYAFDLGISEEVTESVLTDHLERLGGGVTRSTALVDLRMEPDRIVATLEHDGERREVTADWLVGCDGLHSVVRERAGIEFEGTDIEAPWAVFDAGIDGWDDEHDVAAAFFEVPTVILTPLPERRWRVYLRPTSQSSDLVEDATAVVRSYKPNVAFTDVENPTRFHCHSRIARSFRSGRVLLAGDAAHVCTPAEGHGMNTGLQDAFNLGWKLALVCSGIADEVLLDTYEQERRPVAARVVGSGDAAEAGQALTSAGDRAARDVEIQHTFGEAGSAHHEAAAAAELDRSYAESSVVGGDPNVRLSPGGRLPDTAEVQPLGRDAVPIHALTHRPGHTILVLGGPGAEPRAVADLAAELESAHADSELVDAVFGLSTAGTEAGRLDPAAAERLGIEAVTLLAVRPDRYVGFRNDGGDTLALAGYLESLRGSARASDGAA